MSPLVTKKKCCSVGSRQEQKRTGPDITTGKSGQPNPGGDTRTG